MMLLVIDTALNACTVGVFDDERPMAVRSEPMAKGHSERIGGFVRDAMLAAGIGFDALDRIGVTVGPGSFTGLRVGLAFAHGLGEALDRPVIGVSTLQALAATLGQLDDETIAAVIDARRGQVYVQVFLGDRSSGPPEALAIDAAIDHLDASGCRRMIGSGASVLNAHCAERGRDAFEQTDESILEPSAQALARLTRIADASHAPPSPLYLRAPDATPPTRLPGQPRVAPPR